MRENLAASGGAFLSGRKKFFTASIVISSSLRYSAGKSISCFSYPVWGTFFYDRLFLETRLQYTTILKLSKLHFIYTAIKITRKQLRPNSWPLCFASHITHKTSSASSLWYRQLLRTDYGKHYHYAATLVALGIKLSLPWWGDPCHFTLCSTFGNQNSIILAKNSVTAHGWLKPSLSSW